MRLATPSDFAEDPRGSFVVGPTWAVWVASATLCGAVYHGTPSDNDVKALLPFLDLDRHPRMKPPLDVLTDASHVRGLDDAAFRRLVRYVRGRLPDFGRTLHRHAVVHPATDGVVGVAIAGLYRTLGPKFSTHHFVNVPDAFQWLGRGADDPVTLDVEQMTAEILPDLVNQLRALLVRRPGTNRPSAAAALKVSERSLQRALREVGSTFQEEIDRARVEIAAALLADTSEKTESIAQRLGLDATSLVRIFRRATGELPSTFRARRNARR